MTRSAYIFISLVVAAATTLLLILPAGPLFALSLTQALGVAAFVAIGIISERLAIDFGVGRQASSSIAFLPFLACTIVFAPIIAVTTVAIVVTVSSLILSRQDLTKAAFNISQGVLAVALASLVYSLFLPAELRQSAVRDSVDYFGFFWLACVFFGVNILLTGIAIALIRTERIITVLGQVIGPRGGNLWYDLLASPIAVIQAILYRDHYVAGILIILLPLLLIRYSYLSKVQLAESNRDLLKVLVKAIETRDPYTSGHSVRVATLARLISIDLQLSNRKIDEVETAALLHDIGKIDLVYEAVIRKPHDLSADERALIQTHATKGADLLQSLSSVSGEVIKGVRHHHERFDGSGYPDGLLGEAIPLSARLIMLCDSIDAMLSDRPYRRALPIGKVRAELLRCASTQFDPAIVQVVLQRNTLERAFELADRPVASQAQLAILSGSA